MLLTELPATLRQVAAYSSIGRWQQRAQCRNALELRTFGTPPQRSMAYVLKAHDLTRHLPQRETGDGCHVDKEPAANRGGC